MTEETMTTTFLKNQKYNTENVGWLQCRWRLPPPFNHVSYNRHSSYKHLMLNEFITFEMPALSHIFMQCLCTMMIALRWYTSVVENILPSMKQITNPIKKNSSCNIAPSHRSPAPLITILAARPRRWLGHY